MTFRDAVLEAFRNGEAKVDADMTEALEGLHFKPFWTILEWRVMHAYKRRTGKNALRSASDWRKFIEWLVANAPMILEIVKLVISLLVVV